MRSSRAVHGHRPNIGFVGSTFLALLLIVAPSQVSAHFFVQSYALPIPFWMYAWGAVGALFLSFIAVGVFAAVPSKGATRSTPLPVNARPRLRMPFSGLLESGPRNLGFVVFVLFMLSSTAFDGLHATRSWLNFYWSEVNPHLTGVWGLSPREQTALSAVLYDAWQRLALAASPLVYLALFAVVLVAMDLVGRSGRTLKELMCDFSLCLVPIAFVYHVTHYFTLLLAQGGQIIRLVSDPLGVGWNLFGTGGWSIAPYMVDMGPLWHIQIALILAGHVASVWVAHVMALNMYHTPRRAALSQLPMLALMMAFTAFGLWILSLPLQTGT